MNEICNKKRGLKVARNYKLEYYEQELRESFGKTAEEIASIGLKAICEAQKALGRQEILINHIIGNDGHPMNSYDKTEKVESYGKDGCGNEYIRKIITYTSRDFIKTKIRIFEQNWFAGYGLPNPKGGFVGLLDD